MTPTATATDSYTMHCMEVWGGNSAVDNGVTMPGLDAWIVTRHEDVKSLASDDRVTTDPRAVEQLSQVFAHYATGDIARALQAPMGLFRWLEDETATSWGYSIPIEGEQQTATTVLRLLDSAQTS